MRPVARSTTCTGRRGINCRLHRPVGANRLARATNRLPGWCDVGKHGQVPKCDGVLCDRKPERTVVICDNSCRVQLVVDTEPYAGAVLGELTQTKSTIAADDNPTTAGADVLQLCSRVGGRDG